ncbi:MAG: hypothetical protein ACI4F2_03005 [Acutalibacteraceae bacterium]
MNDFSKYYRAYKYMQEILTPDFTHKYLNRCMEDSDKGEDVLKGKTNEKVIDMDWVIAFEEALPYIQKAIDEQRRFIKQVDNVVRIEKAKKITTDSVKHLAQHTNFIAKVENDMVTPNNILTVEREESFEIYENRVLFTLINNALRFVNDKYKNLKQAPTDSYNEIKMKRKLTLNEQVVEFDINYVNESHETRAEELDVVDLNTLSDFDRVRRIRQTLRDFLSTQLMQALSKTTPVRPPLQQTNLLKKNPNFKKAVELWNFIESYKKKGFEIVGEEYSGEMPKDVQQNLYMAMGFEHFMLSISTNTALKNMLEEKYQEENELLEQEKERPIEELKKVIEAQVYARQQEEIEGYLKDIREREKKITELKSEIKNLKMIIDQRDQQILTLKGQVSMLQDTVERLEEELKQVKLKLLQAENRIKELEAIVEEQKAEIERLTAEVIEKTKRIEQLEAEKAALIAQVEALTAENAALKARVAECEARIADLEAQVATLTQELEQARRENAELTAKVQEQAAEIQSKAVQIENLTAKNTQLETSLTNEIEAHKRDVAEQKQSYEAQLSEQKTSYETQLSTQKSSYETELAGQKAGYERQISDNKAAAAAELASVKQSCQSQIESAKQSCEQQIFAAQKDYEAKKLDAQIAFDKERKALEQQHAKALEAQRKEFERKLAAVNKEKDKAYEVEERKFKSKLAKLEKDLNADYNNKVRAVKAKAESEKAAAIKKAKEQVKLAKVKARKKMFTKEELENLD